MSKLAFFANSIKDAFPDLSFNALEIGALPVPGSAEPLHALMPLFESSTLHAFEPDQAVCTDLNRTAAPNIRYIPKALGKKNGKATLYQTENRSCYSLYEPNIEFCRLYRGMESLKTLATQDVDVFKLDTLIAQGECPAPHTIKVDVQGAELDIFKGGKNALESTLLIITEVEFAPLYKDQPLFSDVFQFLREQGFMFHKFDGICGRNLNPVELGKHINLGSQQLWSDAIFIRDTTQFATLDTESLLRLALFSIVYRSPDLTHFCLDLVDKQEHTRLSASFISLLNA